jgi:hypothetical protein
MKATVINVYDEQGNEIKNVSTEIVLNGETYVKKEADKQPGYSHLVGMWVRFLGINDSFTKDKWYMCFGNPSEPKAFKDDNGRPNGFYGFPTDEDNAAQFDLTNPKLYNPDTVVGLKELPNDGKCYAECFEDLKIGGSLRFIKALFYEIQEGVIYQFENKADGEKCCSIEGISYDYTPHFRIHTPAKQVLETCRETMWAYNNSTEIWTKDPDNDNQDESLHKLTKHLNALSYLSEVARRCNGDRVVDFADWTERKHTVIREWNYLKAEWYTTKFNQIVFLDKEARDHSFEVDKHIWNDYYGLPNE